MVHFERRDSPSGVHCPFLFGKQQLPIDQIQAQILGSRFNSFVAGGPICLNQTFHLYLKSIAGTGLEGEGIPPHRKVFLQCQRPIF